MERCAQEARDENLNNEYRSEPLRLILHGVPGVSVFQKNKKGRITYFPFHMAATVLVPSRFDSLKKFQKITILEPQRFNL